MMTELKSGSFRNLIFDLGGVIINLSFQRTFEAFSALSGKTIEEIKELARSRDEFLQYETGKINDTQFRQFIRGSMGIGQTDEHIDRAWNAMLLDIPRNRLEILRRLGERYHLYLLSNTNAIHVKAFEEIMTNTIGSSIENFFDKVYYSHQVGLRKPDKAIYTHVLEKNNLIAEESVFFDDMMPNLEGAGRVGITTIHVTNADELFEKLGSL
jgi:glucose-1-phosphatase